VGDKDVSFSAHSDKGQKIFTARHSGNDPSACFAAELPAQLLSGLNE
jgi:hypothetical protein